MVGRDLLLLHGAGVLSNDAQRANGSDGNIAAIRILQEALEEVEQGFNALRETFDGASCRRQRQTCSSGQRAVGQ